MSCRPAIRQTPISFSDNVLKEYITEYLFSLLDTTTEPIQFVGIRPNSLDIRINGNYLDLKEASPNWNFQILHWIHAIQADQLLFFTPFLCQFRTD
jgi:hypothetical protein